MEEMLTRALKLHQGLQGLQAAWHGDLLDVDDACKWVGKRAERAGVPALGAERLEGDNLKGQAFQVPQAGAQCVYCHMHYSACQLNQAKLDQELFEYDLP